MSKRLFKEILNGIGMVLVAFAMMSAVIALICFVSSLFHLHIVK